MPFLVDSEEDEDESDDDDRRKKKRSIKRKRADFGHETLSPNEKDLDVKRDIDWSHYWGIDRKKKEDPTQRGSRLENMDQKLKDIEDLLIDDTVKYTGAHEGITSPADIAKLKDHVVSRLATAYSLEKMRRDLDRMRHVMEQQNHLLNNEYPAVIDKKQTKRVAVKKEKAEFANEA